MELKLLTELLAIPGCTVKDLLIENDKIFLTVEREGFPICPKCKQSYVDAPKDNRFQEVEDLSVFGRRCFLRLWKFRIDCSCGYKGTEHLEWLERYQSFTVRYCQWIYAFCKRMTGIDVSRIFGISKHTVYRLDKEGIEEELLQQEPVKPKRLSIDEISRKKGHKYATIISAPDEKKVLEVVKGRRSADITPFFKEKGTKWCSSITAVSMDAWLAFRKTVKNYCTEAIICFDHFHLAQHFSKAIDKLRVQESKRVDKDEKKIYKGTRWLLLKRTEKLSEKQQETLDDLQKVNMKLYKAYLLRDEFRQIFNGPSAHSRLVRLTILVCTPKTVMTKNTV